MELLRDNVLQLRNADLIIKEDKSQYRSNREFKDGMFRLLFDDKENALELFNALECTDYTRTDQMEIVTLQEAIFNRFINDLSIQYNLQFVSIVEHQSTWSENLPLREMLYLSRIYEKILDLRSAYKKQQYRIPMPHMYMLYNGEEDRPMEQLMKLSNSFLVREENPSAEIVVKMININNQKQHPILDRSPTLKGYAVFVERVRKNMRYQSMDRDEAIRDAIDSCVKDGILADFLKKHGSEVYNMLFTEITEEDIMEIRLEEAIEERLEQAVGEAAETNTKQIITVMLRKNKSDDEIHELTNVPIEKIMEIRNGIGLRVE